MPAGEMNENMSTGGSQAERMAELVERGLDNPMTRRLLSFVSRRRNGERRAEKILKAYADMEVDLSPGDRIASLFISWLLDGFARRMDTSREEIKDNLREGYWRKGLAATLEGLAWKGARKPFISYAPFLVVWNYTNACNLNCRHCYQNADAPTPDELSTQEAREAVDEMADAGVAYIAFSGGEPLYRDDFFDIAAYVHEKDMGIAVATNGSLLTREKIRQLEALDCQYIQVSVDGAEQTHNDIRGANAYRQAIQGIQRAVDSDITTGVAMTVIEDNVDEVDEVIELTEQLGADIFMHYNFIPTGRGKDIISLDIAPEQREELLMTLVQESRQRDINLLSTAPQYGRVAAEGGQLSLTHFDVASQEGLQEDIQFLAEFVGGCGCGRLYWALQPNGDLTPCVFFPEVLGNIREDDFLEVWQQSALLEQARHRDGYLGRCGSCPSRTICGGCRARAYAYFGDIREDDPGCIRNRDRWEQIKDAR